ncbi:hypothetical protein [Agrobacterium cavarae]|uniref:hypothetical protein n=1 Tax=Agrobacterium cavarae TaxID=2528239 RepID=UPI00289DAFF8|nr:hypothetical protein [Agrobacterium cavarae]
MQRHGKDFLKELLLPLLNRWGRETVLRAIEELQDGSTKNESTKQPGEQRRGIRAKSSALSVAQKVPVDAETRALLLKLATQFDHRSFLPSIGDVRAFLEMRGQNTHGLKQRPDAFRKVISAIVDMPKDGLQQLVQNNENAGGPSQLGPLSDAIKRASATVRSSGESNSQGVQSTSKNIERDQDTTLTKTVKIESGIKRTDKPIGSREKDPEK